MESIGRPITRHDHGIAFTLLDGDRVLGCGGLVDMGAFAGAWLELTDELRARPMVLHRLVRRVLAVQRVTWPVPIVAAVRCDFAKARQWVERLGFQENGTIDGFVRYELAGT